MASGDVMLDASGNVILDDSGNVQLSDGSGDGCCCCDCCETLTVTIANSTAGGGCPSFNGTYTLTLFSGEACNHNGFWGYDIDADTSLLIHVSGGKWKLDCIAFGVTCDSISSDELASPSPGDADCPEDGTYPFTGGLDVTISCGG